MKNLEEGYVLLCTGKKYLTPMAMHFIEVSGIETEILSPITIHSFKRDNLKVRGFDCAMKAQAYVQQLSEHAKNANSWAFAYDEDMQDVRHLEVKPFKIVANQLTFGRT